ncbi:MAG TPA: hypothetical protein VLK65_10985 [Vicinamibacteria bacterium]|nr:hypothetical protein [Vicinamibacteria bacterium]
MSVPTRSDLKALVDDDAALRISLYIPTHRAGPEIQQDPIRLGNLLRSAEHRLTEAGIRAVRARELLDPVRKLVTDGSFWRHQLDGLAIFVTPDRLRVYQLPLELDELVVVADRYHLKPLLSWFTVGATYYLLALSQKQIRLLQGSPFGVAELELEGAPESLAAALDEEAPSREVQFHTKAPRIRGERSAVFHGQGPGGEDKKDELLRYFRIVDDAVGGRLRGESAPLLLACVDYYLPIYREANTYPHLLDEVVGGNPESASAEELHRRAWKLLEPRFAEERNQAAARFRELSGTGLASTDLKECLLAARQGRVASLFAAVGVQRWGRFDPVTSEFVEHESSGANDYDLIDFAATHAIVNGASVYAVEPGAMPEKGAAVAAIFRY